jgi:hypothetical protein
MYFIQEKSGKMISNVNKDQKLALNATDNYTVFQIVTQPSVQCIALALSPRVKRPEREADHSRLVPRSRIRGSIHPLPHTSSWRNALLVKHKDNFTFYEKPIYVPYIKLQIT